MASEPPDSGWTLGDVGHGVLDVAGLIPGYGEAADLANAAWYAGEEKYLEAGLSLISCVPIVGDAVGKGGKLANKLGGPALKKLLPTLKKMNFSEALAPFRKNKTLGPHIDKMIEALNKWRDELIDKARGIESCPQATKKMGEAATVIGKTPVPTRILRNLDDTQLKAFQEAIERVEKMPVPGRDKAVFYSGKVGGEYAFESAERLAQSGKYDSVNTLSDNLLNADGIRDVLPPEAMGFVDRLASKHLAETASGTVEVIGEVQTMTKGSVFRTVELPALLENPAVDAASKTKLQQIKTTLDGIHGPL